MSQQTGTPTTTTSAAGYDITPLSEQEIVDLAKSLSPEEQIHIEGAVQRHFGLDEATAKELISLAETERRQSIDHFQFTRMIAAEYDLGQKMVLAEVMWGVILADGQLATHETWLVRKLAHLLELEPGYLSEARKAAAAREPGPANGSP